MANARADEAGRAVSGARAAGARGLRREAPTCGPGVAGRRGGKLGLSAGRAGEGRPRRGPVARGWSGGALEQARSASHGVGSRGEKERGRAAIPGLGRERRPMRGEGKRAG